MILLYANGLIAAKQTDHAANLLQPLLTSSQWRAEWIHIAEALPVEKDTASWLDRVLAAIPSAQCV